MDWLIAFLGWLYSRIFSGHAIIGFITLSLIFLVGFGLLWWHAIDKYRAIHSSNRLPEVAVNNESPTQGSQSPPRAAFQMFDGREVIIGVGNLGGTEAVFRATGRIVSSTMDYTARDPYRGGWKDGLLDRKAIRPSGMGRLLLGTATFSRDTATISICGDGLHNFATYSVRAGDQFAARLKVIISSNPGAEFTPKDFLLELTPDFKEKILRVKIVKHSVGSYGPPINAPPPPTQ